MACVASSSSSFSSSSSPCSTQKKYHVFISFRGEDTRKTFTSHLYHAFSLKKIKAYIDEESLKKGDEISPALLEGIAGSTISVIILSRDYASSRWCLDELNHILLCKETNNQIVVPVFYGVDPSDVRKQLHSYASAFDAHEIRFKDQMEKVQQWRNSLTTVANLSGFHSSNFGSESQLVEAILEDILKKLHDMLPSDQEFDEKLVGIEKRIQQVELLLNIDSSDAHIVGIWGMGGIGKTALARVIFSRFANQFEGSYFLENVKEKSRKDGLDKVRKKLFSKILSEENTLDKINRFVRDRLRHTKVLIVLDNVDNVKQLEYLAGDRDWFGRGSKIIITTRDKQVLRNIGAHDDETYEVEKLNFDESLHLFCSKAFKQSSPKTDYIDLSERMVHYAKGIPLALEILGSHVYSKSTKQWESELDKLKKIPNIEVCEVLKTSFDELENNEKELFLDIACFFEGEDEDFVKRVLDAFGNRYVESAKQVLIDKALVTIRHSKFHMHDLLQEMGREIVCQESKNPGERSRLWLAEDIYEVLKYNIGTRAIEGISLDQYDKFRAPLKLNPLVFKGMYNLKFLKFVNCYVEEYLYLPQGLDFLPDELRYLRWDKYPSKYLPQDFNPENLVELHLCHSRLEHLWNGVQNVENLKLLNLEKSKNLIQIPNLSRAKKLEEIDLSYCESFEKFQELPSSIKRLNMSWTSIEQVPSLIEGLSHLEQFFLLECKRLKSLPTTIWKFKKLEVLDIMGCLELEYLPEIPEPMENLKHFRLGGTGIRKIPSSIENLIGLDSLHTEDCKNLEFVPDNIYKQSNRFLNFSNCSKLENLPPLTTASLFLGLLDLRNTSISEIPISIKSTRLRFLDVSHCKCLQSLPELPLSIREVNACGCTSLEMISNTSVNAFFTQEEPWNDRYYDGEKFEFNDSLKLDHKSIITEFQIRALRLATGILFRSEEMKFDKPYRATSKVHVSFSGAVIPKWFNHRSDDGCLINVKLPPYYHHTTKTNFSFNFIGIASCVVVSRGNNDEEIAQVNINDEVDDEVIPEFTLKCDMRVKGNTLYQKHLKFEEFVPSDEVDPISNHMHMWYFNRDEIYLSSAKEISFKFSTFVNPNLTKLNFKVERCGIHMIGLQDAVDFGIISSEFVPGESNVITNKPLASRLEIIDLENTNQCPERTNFWSDLQVSIQNSSNI